MRLLALRGKLKRKRRKLKYRKPELTVAQILQWADEWHERTGKWPKAHSGRIPGSLGENWRNVDNALSRGLRGLPGGTSLGKLLQERRAAPYMEKRFSALDIDEMLVWIDSWHARTRKWPHRHSGKIPRTSETWLTVDAALKNGFRGLPGGSSLARLLAERRGVRHLRDLPMFREKQILAWADRWHKRTGKWPHRDSGPIPDSPEETWSAVNNALLQGGRGLPGGSSLTRLLEKHRGVRNHLNLPRLSEAIILEWTDRWHQGTGRWPNEDSGPLPDAPGENWKAIDNALRKGTRGLPAGSSLPRLLEEKRGMRNQSRLPRLSEKQILSWADAYRARTGRWPSQDSSSIPEAPGEIWKYVDAALLKGYRGLPGGSSLARLLVKRRGARNIQNLSGLSYEQILTWADHHHRRIGQWPRQTSGPILAAPGETWGAVNASLRLGARGLPGGSSLHRLLQEHRQNASAS